MSDAWTSALRDPHIPIHWLLEIRALGTTFRYADADLDVSSFRYRAGLKMRTPPGITVDPYTSAPSSPNCTLELWPVPDDPGDTTSMRPLDLEAVYRKTMLAMTARLLRWAEGTTRNDAQQILNAFVYSASLDERGVLRLTLVDRILQYDRAFPRYMVNVITWPNAYADDNGSGYPILYGDFSRVPCPVIDDSGPTYDYILVADETIKTVSAVYYDDVALDGGDYTLQTATDSKGRTVSRVRVTIADAPGNAVGDRQVTVSGTGYPDDANGRYSGTASALLEHPADQMRHMAETMAQMLPGEINHASFIALRSELAGWKASPQVLKDSSSSFFQFREEFCVLLRSAIYPEKGMFTARRLNFKRGARLNIVEGENLVAVDSIEWGDKNNLITHLILKYDYGYVPKEKLSRWRKSVDIDYTDYQGFADNLQILRGISDSAMDKIRRVEARSISDTPTANKIAYGLCELHGRPRKIVRCTVSRDGHDLEIYDVVKLTVSNAPDDAGAGWTRKRFVVIGIAYDLNDNKIELLEC